jgi:hypothetical protein
MRHCATTTILSPALKSTTAPRTVPVGKCNGERTATEKQNRHKRECVSPPILCNMSNRREWDVTVRGRIENVTDQDAFPGLYQAALGEESEISVVRFDHPPWPHTTSVVVRISAENKKDAEKNARDLILPVLRKVVIQIKGEDAFGWTLMVGAALSPTPG